MTLTEEKIRRLKAIGFKWTTTMTKSFQKDSKCDPAGGVGGTVSKEDAEHYPVAIKPRPFNIKMTRVYRRQ